MVRKARMMENPVSYRQFQRQREAARLAALGSARRFIQRRLDILLESVCGTVDGKPDMSTIDGHALPDVRAFKRVLRKIDKAL